MIDANLRTFMQIRRDDALDEDEMATVVHEDRYSVARLRGWLGVRAAGGGAADNSTDDSAEHRAGIAGLRSDLRDFDPYDPAAVRAANLRCRSFSGWRVLDATGRAAGACREAQA